MKNITIISLLIATFLLSGCTKTNIYNTTDAYNYLTEDANKINNLNIDILKNEFENLQYKDVTLSKIPQLNVENIENYSAYSFSDKEGAITIFFEKENIIAVENENKTDNSNVYIQYITNKNIEEIVSTYKDSNSLRVRDTSIYFKKQEEFINLVDNEINSYSLSEYKKLVKSLTDNPKLSLNDIENILNKESVYLEEREVNNVDTKLYTFDYNDSTISIFIDYNNVVQCIIVNNLTIEQDTTRLTYSFEFNPYVTEITFRTSIYHINTPREVQSFNNDTLNILK